MNNLPREDAMDMASTVTVFDISGARAEKPVEIGRVELPLPYGTFVNNRAAPQPNSTAFQFDLDEEQGYLYVALDAELSNGWSLGLIYTSYLAPTEAFAEVHELGLTLGLGSVGRDGAFVFRPRALIAREVHDTGGPEDTYLELGGELGLPPSGVVSWTIPLIVGTSLDGFYRDASGGNERLGFVETGVEADAGLPELRLGQLPGRLTAGITLAYVNRDARITHDLSNDMLWTLRLGLSFDL